MKPQGGEMVQGWQIRVRGQVQGVGFRPFVWAQAHALGLVGHVLNDGEGVLVRAAGRGEALAALRAALTHDAPVLARVDSLDCADWPLPSPLPTGFDIAASGPAGAETNAAPDAATCPDCLAEIRNPQARRYRYPFTNCTNCGPRFSILQGLPYDRGTTTMARFEMCPDCRAEYENPADRRFHAQPIACPVCGPRLWAEAGGTEIAGEAVELAAQALKAGQIIAIKGLGGFHLACDATNPDAIARLRRRKRRPAKPLALMAPAEVLARHATPSASEWHLLKAAAAPIVLLDKTDSLPEGLAPGIGQLGWMLPYTPLHHLLCDRVDGPLVMTSANASGMPQVIGNAEARRALKGLADMILMHDRPIARRLDDSVERVLPSVPIVLRRGRGRVPTTLPLPPGFEAAPPVLALGGQMKAALCLTRPAQAKATGPGEALLSHHLGDLDDAGTWAAWQQARSDFAALLDHRPEIVAVDAHPGYRATQTGEGMGLALERVQHHHAHMASAMGENGWPREAGPVVAIVLDGLGLGPDGTIWGGEVLHGDYRDFERIGHLKPVPLAGGDAASRTPWHNLLMQLDAAGLAPLADTLLADRPRAALRRAAAAGLNSPLTSSAGRLFDAFACALGVAPDRMRYEGEAAMRLEALAARGTTSGEGFALDIIDGVIDPGKMWHAWATAPDLPTADAAAMFHTGLARAFASLARVEVEASRAGAVVLTGGAMQNAVLLAALLTALDGLPVLHHHTAPAGDGGLALGQALVAAARAL